MSAVDIAINNRNAIKALLQRMVDEGGVHDEAIERQRDRLAEAEEAVEWARGRS